jgi:mono/diheme cytochrome c family protein
VNGNLAGLVLAVGLAACAAGSAGSEGAPAAPVPPQGAEVQPAGGGSVLDGVYTSRQASRGENLFRAYCAMCHGQSEFRGARFRIRWSGETVGDIYEFVSTMMPDGDPGSLEPDEYADIVAYFLELNTYPAGESALPADQAALGALRIEPASD